jgi:hypothetical protein
MMTNEMIAPDLETGESFSPLLVLPPRANVQQDNSLSIN